MHDERGCSAWAKSTVRQRRVLWTTTGVVMSVFEKKIIEFFLLTLQ